MRRAHAALPVSAVQLAWLTHLWPPLGYRLGNYALLVGVVGVVVQIFWFPVFGVNEQRWHEQARASRGAV